MTGLGDYIVAPVTLCDVPTVWDMLLDYPERSFFADCEDVSDGDAFVMWWNRSVQTALGVWRGDELLGVGWLDAIYPGYYASTNVIRRRGLDIPPDEAKCVLTGILRYFCETYDLQKLIAVVRRGHRACLVFLSWIGFHVDGILRRHKQVSGVWTDYYLACVLREEL